MQGVLNFKQTSGCDGDEQTFRRFWRCISEIVLHPPLHREFRQEKSHRFEWWLSLVSH